MFKANASFKNSKSTVLASAAAFSLLAGLSMEAMPLQSAQAKPAASAEKEKDKEKDKAAKTPEPVIENVQNVTTDNLVDKPHEYLNKNVRFIANFSSFNTLALDYKPAMRSSKTNLSFIVLRPASKVPYSELKLAMAMPKEKDPQNQVLANLKDGDELELTGKVFSTALDEPWVDILKLKKLKSAPDDKKAEKAEEKRQTETKVNPSETGPETEKK